MSKKLIEILKRVQELQIKSKIYFSITVRGTNSFIIHLNEDKENYQTYIFFGVDTDEENNAKLIELESFLNKVS